MNFRRQDVGERPTASPESSGKNRACPHTARPVFAATRLTILILKNFERLERAVFQAPKVAKPKKQTRKPTRRKKSGSDKG